MMAAFAVNASWPRIWRWPTQVAFSVKATRRRWECRAEVPHCPSLGLRLAPVSENNRGQKPPHLCANSVGAPDDVAIALADHPDAAMLVQLELKLDVRPHVAVQLGLAAALINRVDYHRGVGGGPVQRASSSSAATRAAALRKCCEGRG